MPVSGERQEEQERERSKKKKTHQCRAKVLERCKREKKLSRLSAAPVIVYVCVRSFCLRPHEKSLFCFFQEIDKETLGVTTEKDSEIARG